MGVIDLGPFRKALRNQQESFVKHFLQGHLALELAQDRVTIDLMQADLDKGQSAFEHFFKPDSFAVGTPAERWTVNTQLFALQKLLPAYRDKSGYDRQKVR